MAWAQCCIEVDLISLVPVVQPEAEPYDDYGYDGIPNTGDEGEGNGMFDFRGYGVDGVPGGGDIGGGDMLHNYNEESEAYTDNNDNNGHDIKVRLDMEGLDQDVIFFTKEERSLVDTYNDDDVKTVEYFAINYFEDAGTRGVSVRRNVEFPNQIILRESAIGYVNNTTFAFATAAHELGHVLMDDGEHTNEETLLGRINVMKGGGTDEMDAVGHSKRLNITQCENANGF